MCSSRCAGGASRSGHSRGRERRSLRQRTIAVRAHYRPLVDAKAAGASNLPTQSDLAKPGGQASHTRPKTIRPHRGGAGHPGVCGSLSLLQKAAVPLSQAIGDLKKEGVLGGDAMRVIELLRRDNGDEPAFPKYPAVTNACVRPRRRDRNGPFSQWCTWARTQVAPPTLQNIAPSTTYHTWLALD